MACFLLYKKKCAKVYTKEKNKKEEEYDKRKQTKGIFVG